MDDLPPVREPAFHSYALVFCLLINLLSLNDLLLGGVTALLSQSIWRETLFKALEIQLEVSTLILVPAIPFREPQWTAK